MSQAKVDRYKAEKKNRQVLMAKEKREWALLKAGGVLLSCLIIGWVGFSVYQTVNPPKAEDRSTIEVTDYTVHVDALDEYLGTLQED